MSIQQKAEKNIGLMIVLVILLVSVGGLVQIVPLFFQVSTTEPVEGLKPYDALSLAGRDLYIRESCVSLPLPADPALPHGDRALRPLFRGGGVRL